MDLKVYWTDFAKSELRIIFNYHKQRVSLKIAKNIINQIIAHVDTLSNFPEIGVIEELLEDRAQVFRYIISVNYKIIYWINEPKNRIEIIDVFDTRQNPIKIKRNK